MKVPKGRHEVLLVVNIDWLITLFADIIGTCLSGRQNKRVWFLQYTVCIDIHLYAL